MLRQLLWSALLCVAILLPNGAEGQAAQQGATTLTLDEAIDYAWSNSNEIKNARLAVADAEQQIVEQRSTGLPSLNGDLNYQRFLAIPQQALPDAFVDFLQSTNPGEEVDREVAFQLKNNFTASLNLDAMVFDPKYFAALRAARTFRTYTAQELMVVKRDIKNNVIQAYLPLLLADRNLEIIDQNIGNLEQLTFETRQLYKEGFAEQLDVDRLELSLFNLKTERENLQRQRETTLNTLKTVLNYPMDQPLELGMELDLSLTQISDAALVGEIRYQNRPEYELINQGLELREVRLNLDKVSFFPSVSAFGAVSQTYQGNTFSDGFWAPNAFVGVNVTVPIFDGFYKKAQVERSRLEIARTTNQRSALKQNISREVKNARIAYQNAKESLDNQKRSLRLAQKIYDTTQIKYREGVGSSVEVTQAEQSLYDSQSNYTQALYNLVRARYDLELALGR